MNKPLSAEVLEAGADRYATHPVRNQAQPAAGFNAFTGDAVIRAAVAIKEKRRDAQLSDWGEHRREAPTGSRWS